MNRCNCSCDPNRPENCKFCWCVGSPGSFGPKQLCHCCAAVKEMNDQPGMIAREMEIKRHPERVANTNCKFCLGSGRFQTMSGLCICVETYKPFWHTFAKSMPNNSQ